MKCFADVEGTYILRLVFAVLMLSVIRIAMQLENYPNFNTVFDFIEESKNISGIYNDTKTQNDNSSSIEFERMLNASLDRAEKNTKVILYWDGDREFQLGWKCGSCKITSNSSMINNTSTAAVVFLYKKVTPKIMPRRSERRTDQLYVWLTGESPANLVHYRKMTFGYENVRRFNATMSYRRDADIYQPYGHLETIVKETDLSKIMQTKKRAGIALVSNCYLTPAAGARKQLLLQISQKFPVDLYGRCFKEFPIDKSDQEATKFFLKPYKFYFAFENSYRCRDYYTEKVFRRALGGNLLPVVWGTTRKDYEAVMPPESFIHVDDFRNLDELAEYLHFLNRNNTAYLEHFKWLEDYLKEPYYYKNRAYSFCQLCRIANGINVDDVYRSDYNPDAPFRPLFTPTVAQREVKSLREWIMDDNPECFVKPLRVTDSGQVVAQSKFRGKPYGKTKKERNDWKLVFPKK